MIKKIALYLFFLMSVLALPLHAKVQFTASAPEAVVMGEHFRISFTVNTQDVSNLTVPDFNGFDVLIGPKKSSHSSFTIINGKRSQSSSITYTYILSAQKEGTFTIPGATIQVKGDSYKSNSVKIRVLPRDDSSQSSSSSGGATRMHTQTSGSKITGKDLFIQVTANKKRVYEQEAVLLTYKVYTLVNLTQLAGNMPDLDGFHTQEISLPQQKSMTLEHVNGKNYGTVVWRQYVLFPQKSGKLTVPAIEFEGVVEQQNRNVDPIDAFFNGANLVTEVKTKILAPALTLDVMPLPERPKNFSGAVGSFQMDATWLPESGLKTNEALTLKLKISGAGNMKLLAAPEVAFPKDFETYNAKVNDQTKLEKRGAAGTKEFEYIAVPRHKGNYTIPAVEFCYFDPDKGAYQTLKTEPYQVNVAQGVNRQVTSESSAQEELKLLNSDIRHIKSGEVTLYRPDSFFFASSAYWISLGVILLLTILAAVYLAIRSKDEKNVARMKGKKANSVATKRLKQAKKLLDNKESGTFYEELSKTLWGYVSDKLTIALAELNKENIQQRLEERGVSQELASRFNHLLDECEFARFAPGDPVATMDKMYHEAVEVISELESTLKK